MMKLIAIIFLCILAGCGSVQDDKKAPQVEVIPDEAASKVDVLVDGKLFTSYIYPQSIKKPVLWPVVTSGGNDVTRSFPLKNKGGERVDHPHHVGIWLNHGDVNGLDFWNNSDSIAMEDRYKYGTIRHQQIKDFTSGAGEGTLTTASNWLDSANNVLLEEVTKFSFKVDGSTRIIDRATTLTAKADTVTFTDNKEGMFAIRVSRALELPVDEVIKLSDSHGKVTTVEAPDNSNVTGDYLSSEGVTGADVWSTRADWMKLFGEVDGEKVALVIYDNKENVGYPTYWHARAYGLFSANPLGESVFTKGKKELNFSLSQGESTTFKYRMAIFSGEPTREEIEKLKP